MQVNSFKLKLFIYEMKLPVRGEKNIIRGIFIWFKKNSTMSIAPMLLIIIKLIIVIE